MNNYNDAPTVSPTSSSTSQDYNFDSNNSITGKSIVYFFIFALILVVALIRYLSRSCIQQQRRREQEQELNNLHAVKAQEPFRMKLIHKMTKENLTVTLTSLNFRSGNDNTASPVLDIEQGGMVPVLGETIGDVTLPEITEVGAGSDENHHTEQNSEMRACDTGVVVEEPNNNNVNLRLEDETLDDTTEQDVQQPSNEESAQAPDLESGTWNRTDGSKRRSSLASIRKSVKSILEKKSKSRRRSTNRSSMQGEIFVTRAGKRVSICTECAICLDTYVPGDTIAFSGNVLCKHVFHQECILDYLVQKMDQEAPCPYCRQVFLPKGSKSSNTDDRSN